jgi:hypothetical protein
VKPTPLPTRRKIPVTVIKTETSEASEILKSITELETATTTIESIKSSKSAENAIIASTMKISPASKRRQLMICKFLIVIFIFK